MRTTALSYNNNDSYDGDGDGDDDDDNDGGRGGDGLAGGGDAANGGSGCGGKNKTSQQDRLCLLPFSQPKITQKTLLRPSQSAFARCLGLNSQNTAGLVAPPHKQLLSLNTIPLFIVRMFD